MNKNDLRKVRDALAKSAEHLDSPPAYVIATVAILDAELAADPQPVGEYLGTKKDDCGEREECVTWEPLEVGTSLYASPVPAPDTEKEELREALANLMAGCAKKVKDWNFPEYDDAARVLIKQAERAKNEEKNHG